jgi:hypothetical protein
MDARFLWLGGLILSSPLSLVRYCDSVPPSRETPPTRLALTTIRAIYTLIRTRIPTVTTATATATEPLRFSPLRPPSRRSLAPSFHWRSCEQLLEVGERLRESLADVPMVLHPLPPVLK